MTAARALPMKATIGLFFLLSLNACTDRTSVAPADASVQTETSSDSRVLVTTDLVTLRTGESALVRLTGESDAAPARRWSTDNGRIAAVDADGNITGLATGTTTVTVTSGERTTDILVTVLPSRERLAAAGTRK